MKNELLENNKLIPAFDYEEEKNERNYGIDLLRLLSMFFVVILHCLGQGGILNNTELNSIQYKFAWFMEICAYCAVDIFALISGYVLYTDDKKKFNYSNYINLWLQVVFYGLFVTFIFNIIYPSIISKRDYLIVLFPITNNLYWYFTAYTGLFILIPFLNKGIKNCSDNTIKKMFIMIIILFTFINTISNGGFVLNRGYSFIWLLLIYILGASIKKCNIGKNLKNYQFIIGVLFLYLITYLYKIYGVEISIFGTKINNNTLVEYTSPTILLVSILYIIQFSKMKFNNFIKKVIKFAAPCAFTIYILNNHRLVWKYIMKNLFIDLSNQSIIKIFIYVVTFSGLFMLISILIGKIQLLLFKILNIKTLANKVSDTFNKILNKIATLI